MSDWTALGSNPGVATVPGVAGENIVAYQVCYLGRRNKYYRASAASSTTLPAIVIAPANINLNASGTFIRRGPITNSAWVWAVGEFVFVDTITGGLTQDTSGFGAGDYIQIMGVALATNQLDFDPQLILNQV